MELRGETSKGIPFHGRRIVLGAFLSQFVANAVSFSAYGLFVEPIEDEFGATRAQVLLGTSILLGSMSASGPWIGRLVDRGGVRRVMLVGAFALAAGFLVMAHSSRLWQLGILSCVPVGVGVAMVGTVPTATLVANWFVRHRGTALGLVATGATTAGIVMPPVVAALIGGLGWRGTLMVYAVIASTILIPVVGWLVVRRPEDLGEFPDGDPTSAPPAEAPVVPLRAILGEADFWLIATIFGVGTSAAATMMSNLVPFAGSLGVEPGQAAYVLSSMSAFSLMGRILFGTLVDRLDTRTAVWLCLGLQACAWTTMLGRPGYGLLLASGSLYGLGIGGLWPMRSFLIGAIFGRVAFGRATGLVVLATLPFTVAIPPIAGHLYDVSASYRVMLAPFLGAFALAAGLLALVRTPRRPSRGEGKDAGAPPRRPA